MLVNPDVIRRMQNRHKNGRPAAAVDDAFFLDHVTGEIYYLLGSKNFIRQSKF
jgi:hypothetical protein